MDQDIKSCIQVLLTPFRTPWTKFDTYSPMDIGGDILKVKTSVSRQRLYMGSDKIRSTGPTDLTLIFSERKFQKMYTFTPPPPRCIGVVEDILIGFLHIFVSTGYPISHKIFLKCPFMQTTLALQNHGKSFSQLVHSLQKLAVLATFLPYQIALSFGAIWIPLSFSNENQYIS